MANEIDRRYGSKGLHATSLHPGAIDTPLGKFMDPKQVEAFRNNEASMRIVKSPEQGAATTVVAAVGKEWEDKGGKYLVDCAEATRGEDDDSISGVGYVAHTYDPEREAKLWRDSLEMVGLKNDI
jgi:hypothetical protein